MIRKAILILCVLAAIGSSVLWVWSRSLPTGRSPSWPLSNYGFEGDVPYFGLRGNDLLLIWSDRWSNRPTVYPWKRVPTRRWEFLGLAYHSYELLLSRPSKGAIPPEAWSDELELVTTITALKLPFWLPVFFFSVIPLIIFVRASGRRRRHRLRHNLCLGCGYSLKGLPSLKCPECATPFDLADLPKD